MHKTAISQADTLFQKYFLFKSFKDDGDEMAIWKYLRDMYDENYPLKGSPFGAIIINEIEDSYGWQDEPIFDKVSLINFKCTDDPLAQLLFLQEALKEGAYNQDGYPRNMNRLMYETLYRLKKYEDALVFVKRASSDFVERVYRPQQNDEDFGHNNILLANIFCLARAGRHLEVVKRIEQYLLRDRIHGGYDDPDDIDLLQHIHDQTQKILQN